MQLFGFSITRADEIEEKQEDMVKSFVNRAYDDGAVEVVQGGSYGTFVDMDGSARSEAELITKYRELSQQPDIDYAIDEIVNEAISYNEDQVVDINTDQLTEYGKGLVERVRFEFDELVEMLDFNNTAYDLFRRWYIDGRCMFHIVVDPEQQGEGIQEIRYIDPRKIKKIREITKQRVTTDVMVNKVANEYYMYSERGFGNDKTSSTISYEQGTQGFKIAKDSIIDVTSGLMDPQNKMVLSYLHKAIRPMNQMRALEDSVLIYRISRAPERRIFYVDVGNLPKAKAEQYLRDMMVKHKNRSVYNAETGEIRDDRRHMTMLEDFWLPRREGGRGTEITTLPGAQNLGELDDVQLFQQKLNKALNVPITRLEPGQAFSIGRASEITRDELKFQKFISRLRAKFGQLFLQALERQLILKEVISEEDWKTVRNNIKIEFTIDSHFVEMKNSEVLAQRADLAQTLMNMPGFYSAEWVRKNVLMQSDEEIELIMSQIQAEQAAMSGQSEEQNNEKQEE